MSYSKTEKYLAQVLAKFPQLKLSVKKFYSIVNFQLYKKSYSFKTKYNITASISDENNESFFGYYDKSPVNSSGRYIIFHETNGIHTHRSPDPAESLSVMLYDTEKKYYQKISETTSYNWQQGSKLMWLDESRFIFNDYCDSHYVSRIYDIRSKEFSTADLPVYDCFKDQFALSVNFLKLNSTDKDYGYKNINNSIALNDIKNDGIYFVDLKNNSSKLLINFERVIGIHYKESMKNALHSFNHIMISPNGKNFIFIHRWYDSGKRYDSLILSNIQDTGLKVLADEGFVSHCCWMDSETVVGYLKDKSYGNTFYKINIISSTLEILSNKLKNFGDGHPSFFGNKMLFDSYPDRSRMQHLYIFDVLEDEFKELGCFLSTLKFFGDTRCDLHPRWAQDGKTIFFDSTHEGKRTLYRIILS